MGCICLDPSFDGYYLERQKKWIYSSKEGFLDSAYILKISTKYIWISKTDDCIFNNSGLEDFLGVRNNWKIADDDKALSEFNKSIQLVIQPTYSKTSSIEKIDDNTVQGEIEHYKPN